VQKYLVVEPPARVPARSRINCAETVRFSQTAILSNTGQVLAKSDSLAIETHEACDWARLFKNKKVCSSRTSNRSSHRGLRTEVRQFFPAPIAYLDDGERADLQ